MNTMLIGIATLLCVIVITLAMIGWTLDKILSVLKAILELIA